MKPEPEDKEFKNSVKNLMSALKIIKAQTPARGEIDCPACGNKLAYVKQFNGHVWGKCKTEDCLSWMQ